MKRIVIATDGSAEGREAVEYGLDLARCSYASATVIYVRQAPRLFVGDRFYQREISEELRREGDAGDHAAHVAADLDVQIDVLILEGDPATVIIELARLKDADLIVLGSRNRGPLVAALLGSVSNDVVTHTDRPVLVTHAFDDRRRALAPS
jgi:nucleotide-binding universal stress UspA family protein